MPKALMAVGHQLSVRGKSLEGRAFEDRRVTMQIVEHTRLEYEEAAVDPAFAGLRLLVKVDHLVAVHDNRTESCRGTHGGHGSELAMRPMKLHERLDVDVGDAVTVRERECAV